MKKVKQLKSSFILILVATLCLFGETSVFQIDCYIQNEALDINTMYTKTDFKNFKVTKDQNDIHSEITPEEISITHNDTFYSDIGEKFIIEYNIGRANFSDFDITLDLAYNLSLSTLFGEIAIEIGSDYDPNALNAPEKKLCFSTIKDKWEYGDGVFSIGAYTDIFPDEYEISTPYIVTPGK